MPYGVKWIMFSCFIIIMIFKNYWKVPVQNSCRRLCRSKKGSRILVSLNEIKVKSAEMKLKIVRSILKQLTMDAHFFTASSKLRIGYCVCIFFSSCESRFLIFIIQNRSIYVLTIQIFEYDICALYPFAFLKVS